MPQIKAFEKLELTQDVTYNDVLQVDGILEFPEDKSITLTLNNQNFINNGLVKITARKGVVHKIVITGVDEKKMVGNSDTVLDSDKGIWTMGAGRWEVDGGEKTPHTKATAPLSSGQVVLPVQECEAWEPGDEIAVAPTLEGDFEPELRKIVSVSGLVVTIDKALSRSHPVIEGHYPEVFNLTRNIRIEGTPGGMIHTFFKSTSPQQIKGIQYRYCGPRKDIGGDKTTEKVLGRYVIHFHHSEDGSRGSEIEDCVARDCNSPFMVAHGSHGIMWCDNISYNCAEHSAWYDPGHSTHDNTFEDCFSVYSRFFAGSLQPEDQSPLFGSGGFLIGMGDNNTYRRCWVIGGGGGDTRADYTGGFEWRAKEGDGSGKLLNEGVAMFEDCGAHNYNSTALRGWQNTDLNHLIKRFFAFHCKVGIFLGAYANCYKFNGGSLIKAPFIIHAGATGGGIIVQNMNFKFGGYGDKDEIAKISSAIFIEGSPVEEIRPITLLNCTFDDNCVRHVYGLGTEKVHNVDIINCNGNKYFSVNGVKIRVQAKGQSGFAPTIWGTGEGLLGEYFGDKTFTKKLFERVEQIAFPEWIWGVHHLVDAALNNFSVRWTGFLEAQFNETYSFRFATDGGSATLYIDGKKITGPVALKTGIRYKIKVEYISDAKPGIVWIWNCPSLGKWNGQEYVPAYQLYSPDIAVPSNKPPIANAGSDITITLPVNSVVLNGSGSDTDGTIASYLWKQVSGPLQATIATPLTAATAISGMAQGAYVFRLQVVDNNEASGTDDVTVTVKPEPVNIPPVVTIGGDTEKVISEPLVVQASDPDGNVVGYLWIKESGPDCIIVNATTPSAKATNLVDGIYVFSCTATDDKGAKTKVSRKVTVKS